MAAQKQSLPSFASIFSVLSIVFYCAGFLRVELELNEQKKRINTLESIAETKPSSNIPDFEKLTKNAQGFLTTKFYRNKRQADSVKNTTDSKSSADTVPIQKINKLLSELKPHLCHAKGDTCPPGPPGQPGPRGEKGSRGRRGQKGRTGNKGDRGIMGSPGKSGKQGIMGPVGPKGHAGLKGQKGDLGPTGMPGAKGEPGESISAPVVVVSPKKLTVNESGSALFQCSVSGNPEPAIVWSKLDKQSTISQSAVSRGKLLLKNVAGSDSGTYNCSAVNILGQAQALVQLVVNVRPRVSLHPGPHHAIEGSSFILPTCHVTGYPAPVVTWRKSSGQLPQGRVKYNNSALQILHVRKDDSDLYFCSAANLLGRVEKKTFLVVVSPPRFTVKPPAKVYAEVGETLRLNCSATGDPQPVISWKKQGGQLPVARSQQINGGLVIRDLTKNDKGNYICVATNAGVFKAETVTYTDVDTLGSSSILGSLDSKYRAKLNSYLAPVLQSPGRSRFVRCWHAKTDGWAASTFHSNCDGKGPTVTIVQVGSYIFGGYTDKSWFSPNNLALNQPASQVSTVHGGDASRAVDGDTSTDYSDHSCTHTNFANDAWWRVDLGSPFPVAEVVIVNRQCTEACADVLRAFEIRIGNSTSGADSSNQICGSSLQVATGQKKSFRCVSTIRGRYVFIIIPGNNKVLTICEVEVYSTISSSCHHVSSNKSFLFSLYNIKGYAPVKLKIKSSGYRKAIYACYAGPTFGGGTDLHISNNAASNQRSYTSCGYSYPLPPGYSASRSSCRFYAGGQSYKFTPSDIEVFYETTT